MFRSREVHFAMTYHLPRGLCAPDLSESPLGLRSVGRQAVTGRKTRAKLVCVLCVCGCLPTFPSNMHVFILEIFVRFIANERESRQKQNDICWAGRTVSKSILMNTPMFVCLSGGT